MHVPDLRFQISDGPNEPGCLRVCRWSFLRVTSCSCITQRSRFLIHMTQEVLPDYNAPVLPDVGVNGFNEYQQRMVKESGWGIGEAFLCCAASLARGICSDGPASPARSMKLWSQHLGAITWPSTVGVDQQHPPLIARPVAGSIGNQNLKTSKTLEAPLQRQCVVTAAKTRKIWMSRGMGRFKSSRTARASLHRTRLAV